MNSSQASSAYVALNDDEKVALLGRVSFDLTIAFRDLTAEASLTQEQIDKLRAINELQHVLLGQLLAHQGRKTARYPDADFFAMLVRMARSHALLQPVQQSLIQQMQKTASA